MNGPRAHFVHCHPGGAQCLSGGRAGTDIARPRATTYDDQRTQFLAAAAGLFARRGYTATTMNEVAAASGVSKATLYRYVSDKAGRLEDIARGHVERLEAAARPGLDRSLHKPLAMLLFGMINWTFTWLRPAGSLPHQVLPPVVADLFLSGLGAVHGLAPAATRRRTKTPAE